MNRQKLIMAGVLVVVALSISSITLFEIPTNEYIYTQSDITKANPKLQMAPTESYLRTTEISETKDTVILTVSGTVTSVGDPIVWDYEGDTFGAVPVTIDVDKKTKDSETQLKLGRGASFTFYLGGIYEQGHHHIFGFEPQFEIGEDVLVHIGKLDQGPDGEYGDNYFVVLGEFGKYKIHEDKAYNEKHTEGKPLSDAFNEAI